MTWIEITFFVLLFGVFVFGCIISHDGSPLFILLPFMFIMVFGAFPYLIVKENTEVVMVKEEPVKILSNVMVDGKMVIITDTAEKVEFTEYKDVTDMNSGKQLVKRFYKKDVYYGPDTSWDKIEIK